MLLIRNAHAGPLRSKQKPTLLVTIQYSSFKVTFLSGRKTVHNVCFATGLKALRLN